ncbi:MAG TPA: 2-succinyl-5-enolpyruvyl-6-hydroxy-3-cyclohexene-1-carboxylic-acid synthase [Solirubrobacterales bacterium]|nr:2-succinyl-5-enolpyruvyl-6-hydroxy-3-cyclohexene-1-carboxylic-acid synthase [Solirubrobacterales bacterium]
MDPTNRNTALASAFAEELARSGVRHAVLSPGSRSTPLAVALHREDAIDLTVIVDERSAGFFALGAAQATRTPVAVLCTSGTAAANLHPAVCEADESGVPLLVLTADRPPELRDIGAGQTIDQLKLYGDAVRWFCEVGTHEADDEGLLHYRSTACRAFAAARGEPRSGPVHLNFAWREPLAPMPGETGVTATDPLALQGRDVRPLTAVTPIDARPDDFALDELARHLREAESGVIVAGRQTDPGLREPLARLGLAAGFPILAEPTSQLRWGPHDRGNVVSAYDAILRGGPLAESPADLVLRFGEMPTSKSLRAWVARARAEIAVDPSGGWNEPTRRAAAVLRAGPAALATGIAERLGSAGEPPAAWLEADAAAREAFASELDLGAEPTEPALQLALARSYADGDLVYTASSMPIRDQEAFLPPGEADVLFLANRGANGIDGLVSSGIGAAHASGRPTTVVTGDLGMLHDIGALAALGAVSVPVRIVVIDNGGGGIFEFLPQADALDRREFEELLGTARALDLAASARAFGIPHRRVERLTGLGDALAAGTGLIELPVERRANVELHRRLNGAASVQPTRGS